jgi:hypothetical protein
MSRNNNHQQIQEIASSIPTSAENLLRTQQKNIVCTDCGGISAAKIQELLSTLEGNTQLFNHQNNKIRSFPTQRLSKTSKSSSSNRINKKKNSMRNNNNQKNSPNRRSSLSLKRNIKKTQRNVINPKRRLHSTKRSNTKKRISLSSRNNNKSKSQNNKKPSIKKTRLK